MIQMKNRIELVTIIEIKLVGTKNIGLITSFGFCTEELGTTACIDDNTKKDESLTFVRLVFIIEMSNLLCWWNIDTDFHGSVSRGFIMFAKRPHHAVESDTTKLKPTETRYGMVAGAT